MLQNKKTVGVCDYCEYEGNVKEMAVHLRSCSERPLGSSQNYQLIVSDQYNPGFWIHVGAPATKQLVDLDRFLRELWLDCCGHSSAFREDKILYTSEPAKNFLWDERGLETELNDALNVGKEIEYQYDFGSTTYLRILTIGTFSGEAQIQLMARNKMPELSCVECGGGNPEYVCSSCRWEAANPFVCQSCRATHDQCDFPSYLPVVNSPRMGVCGYTGREENVF